MANTIRTPRLGITATSRRIAQAVDDEEWQKFRLSMKGKSTEKKLAMLRDYYNAGDDGEDVSIRVDNYIKALCRGGQLEAGESLDTALGANWQLPIRK